ncbi:hypothetical protein KBG31_00705 [Patescibacteria group bacterium]|nr:hypothetical protein [Patescibacteria group bacterium]HOM77810.1 hypothetical protein [bacterium]
MRRSKREKDLRIILRNRIIAIFVLFFGSLAILIGFGPKIGSIFGLISVNRNATISVPKANTPPPIFVETPVATNKTKVDLRGFATPKSTVELFVNGPKKATVITDASGEFLFTDVELNKSTNTIFAKIGDTKSANITIEFDNKPPKIEIETPKDGDEIENLNERIEISGKISEKADILINDRIVIQKPDDSFSFFLGVEEGEVEIIIKATDFAGNTAEEKIKVHYKKK